VNTLLDRDPDSYFGYAERALILFHLDRDKQAIKDADRAISMRPGSTSGYVTKARALSALGQRADALTLLDGALEKTGPSAFITYWQADLLTKDNRFADAVTVLNRSVERGVADHYDYRLMGYALIEQDKFDEARKVVDLALAESQTSYSVYLDAILMVEAGQMDDGVARFDTAMSKGLAAYRVGDFNKRLIRMGEIKRAIELRAKYKSASD
jgi:tetratricopeptide (TPR) repeat protein